MRVAVHYWVVHVPSGCCVHVALWGRVVDVRCLSPCLIYCLDDMECSCMGQYSQVLKDRFLVGWQINATLSSRYDEITHHQHCHMSSSISYGTWCYINTNFLSFSASLSLRGIILDYYTCTCKGCVWRIFCTRVVLVNQIGTFLL